MQSFFDFRMNDISFSSADTQGWNNATGNTPVSSGNYNMQQIPTYSEYLGLPFKLEAGTNAISIANQHQVQFLICWENISNYKMSGLKLYAQVMIVTSFKNFESFLPFTSNLNLISS